MLASEWKHTRLQMWFIVTYLWIMGSGFGLVVNVTYVRVVSEEPDEKAEPVRPFLWANLADALGAFPSTTISGKRSRNRRKAPMPVMR